MYQHQHPASPLPNLQLPRTLNRPAYTEVQREAILDVEPNLGQVPFEYIRKGLHARGEELMASITAAKVPSQLPRSRLSTSFDIAPTRGTPPTHILAVQSSPSSKHPVSDIVFLIPTHQIVLAANCAHIPRIPASRSQIRSNGMLAIPVMPLVVPHAEAFAPLHSFIVAHRLDRLMSALLPVPPSMLSGATTRGSGSGAGAGPFAHVSAPQVATYLAASAAGDKMSALMALTRTVSAIWRNACALGVFDRDLWAALDFSWEVILGAMNMVATGAV
ncbi:hypothetical protein B0F90DRAFT_1811802 [Multifurca ochricompacta]|uniref:Uncharacterized protein n=1 Tax=Multifurca ochricompacta TaxID=376703 RepID=A0AAD4LWV4_9AGAM|nr:hypothetical protein B0F90DRAFT_1811802 [Multifurca ochricompacta]